MPEVRAELFLDLSEALAGVQELADSTAVALEGVPVTADISEAQAAIGSLTEAEPTEIPVTADTADAVASIEDFAAVADALGPLVSVDADTAAAQAELDQFATLAEATDYVVPVDADTGDAEEKIAGLGDSIEQAGGQASGAQDSVSGFGSSAGIAGGAAALARGNVEGASSAFGGLASRVPVAGAALAAGAVALGTIFTVGEKSAAAIERLDLVLGDSKDAIENLDVGGLTGELGDLAIKSGSSAAGVRQAAAGIAQLGIDSGYAKPQAAQVASQIEALALRAVALNPALGEAGQAMEGLGRGLTRGGRFAAKFGIDLTSGEVAARAMQDRLPGVVGELSYFEKQAAGAAIAVEKLGGKIGTDFQKGSEQSAVQFKALEKQFQSLLATLGRPLVEPFLALAKATVPIAQVTAGLVEMGLSVSGVVPIIETLADGVGLLAPVFDTMAAGMQVVADNDEVAVVLAAVGAAALIGFIGIEALSNAFFTAALAVGSFTVSLVTNPIFLAVAALGAAAFALGVFGGATQEADKDTEAFGDALAKSSGALDENATKALKAAFAHQGLLNVANNAGISFDRLADAVGHVERGHVQAAHSIDGTGDALSRARSELSQLQQGFATNTAVTLEQAHKNLATATDSVTAAAYKVSPALGDVVSQLAAQGRLTPDVVWKLGALASKSAEAANAQGELTAATGESALSTIAQQEAFDKTADAAKRYKAALDLASGQGDLASAQIAMSDAVNGLGAAWAEAANDITIGDEAGNKNVGTMIQAADKARELATQVYAVSGSADQAAGPLRDLASRVAFLGASSGQTPEAIAHLLVQMDLIPPSAEGSIHSVDDLNAAIAKIGPGATGAKEAAAAAFMGIPVDAAHSAELGKAAFGAGAAAWIAAGSSAGKGLADGAKAELDKTPGHAGKATAEAAAAGTRNTGLMAAAGAALGAGFANGLLSSTGLASSAGAALASHAAAGTRGTGAMAEAGTALSNAFANAIRNGQDTAYAAGQSLARSAAAGARNAGSPSEHLFSDAGEDMTRAFAVGMVSVAAVARGAAQQVVRSAVPGAAGAGAQGTPAATGTNLLEHRQGQAADAGISVHVEGVTDPYEAAMLVARELAYQRQLQGV